LRDVGEGVQDRLVRRVVATGTAMDENKRRALTRLVTIRRELGTSDVKEQDGVTHPNPHACLHREVRTRRSGYYLRDGLHRAALASTWPRSPYRNFV